MYCHRFYGSQCIHTDVWNCTLLYPCLAYWLAAGIIRLRSASSSHSSAIFWFLCQELTKLRTRLDSSQFASSDIILNMLMSYRDIQVGSLLFVDCLLLFVHNSCQQLRYFGHVSPIAISEYPNVARHNRVSTEHVQSC